MHVAVHNVKENRGKARFAEYARPFVENVRTPRGQSRSRMEGAGDEACRSIAGGC